MDNQFSLPILRTLRAGALVDERFTSAEASGMLREAGIRGRRQKAYLDQVAAQTILEDFFSNDEAVS